MPVTYDLDGQKRVYATWAKFYDRIYQNMLARPQREAVEVLADFMETFRRRH